jgi:hypothetical protein
MEKTNTRGAEIVGVFRVKNHDFTPTNEIFSNCEGDAKIFGVFRVKNHDFTPKIIFFPIEEGDAKIFGVFRLKNHDFTPKIILFPISGEGACAGCAPPPPIHNILSLLAEEMLWNIQNNNFSR